MDLGHRIVAMVGTAPKRVMCMTCDSEHNYRSPKSEDAPKKTATRKKAVAGGAGGAKKLAARDEWEAKVRSGAPLRRYTISETFKEGDLMTHKKFGDGHVVSVAAAKIIVAFLDGERTLVHGQ